MPGPRSMPECSGPGREGWDSGPGPGHSPSAQAAQPPVDIPLQQPLQQGAEVGREGVGQLHSLQGGGAGHWQGQERGRQAGVGVQVPSTWRARAQHPESPPASMFALSTEGAGHLMGQEARVGMSSLKSSLVGDNQEYVTVTPTGDPALLWPLGDSTQAPYTHHGQCHAINLMLIFGLVLPEGAMPG